MKGYHSHTVKNNGISSHLGAVKGMSAMKCGADLSIYRLYVAVEI
jgi:hypothetical protein